FEGVRADLEGRLRLVRVRATELRDDPNALEVAIAVAKQTIEADGPALVRAAAAVDAVYPTAVLETLREQYERAISGMTPAERQAWARRLEGTVASVPGAFEAAKQAVPTELVDRVRGAVAVLHDNLDLGDYVGFFSEAGGQAQVLRNAEELHRLKERAEQDKALVTAAKNEANFILVGAGVREQLDALVAQLAAGVEPERLPLEPGDLDPATYTTVPSAFAGMAVASALAGAAEHLATQAVQYRLHEDAAKERGDEVLAAESASGKAEVAYVDRHTRENWQAHKDAVAAVAGAYGRYADAMTALSTGSATLRDAANDLGAKVIAWINSGEDARDKVPEVTAIVARIQRLRKHFLAQFVRDSEEAADVRKEKERRDAVARAFDMRNPPPEPRPPQPPAPVPQRSAWERAQDILNKPASEEPHRFALDDLTFISGADATLLERATDVGVAFAARGQLSDQLRSTEAAVGAAASESKTAGTVFTTAVAQTPRQTDPALTALLKAARDAAQTLLDDQRAALRLRALYATNSKTLLDAVNALRSGLEVSLLDQEGDQDRVEDAAHRVQALVRRGIELSRDDVTALSNAQAAVVSAQAVVDQREAWNISTPVFVPSGDVMTVAAAGVSFPESEEVLHVPMQFDVVINGGRLAGTAYPTYYGTTLSAGVGLLIEHVKGDLYAVGNRSAPQIIQRARTRDPSMASFTLGKLTTVFPVDRILAGGALTDAKDRTFVQVGLAGSELRYVLLGVKNPSHEDF
ncbi:MAG TPA: hypothetical protein VKD22_02220, partial [Ramlibacter sp.]|nr:hypothetical protein [Ramlibacter sp.]